MFNKVVLPDRKVVLLGLTMPAAYRSVGFLSDGAKTFAGAALAIADRFISRCRDSVLVFRQSPRQTSITPALTAR